jgi:hypothetical protein
MSKVFLPLIEIIFLLSLIVLFDSNAQTPKQFTIKPEVKIFTDSNLIIKQFSFGQFPFAGELIIKKKSIENDFWESVDTLKNGQLTFSDTTIKTEVEEPNEYGFEFFSDSLQSFGYYLIGNKNSFELNNGNVLILVDSTVYPELKKEIFQFAEDLIADGWSPEIKTVPRCETFNPIEIRKVKRVVNKYKTLWSKNFKALILVGRVAVPYTGNYTFDGHPEHVGAFPSDLVYVLPDSLLSDEDEYNIQAVREQNRNVPFDGKFDQTIIPQNINIAVGRIDFSQLPDFPQSEIELLKNYFHKNHSFRMGEFPISNKCLIDDGFGIQSDEIFSADAWMNFQALCDTIIEGKLIDNIKENYYRFTYACNSGSYTSCWSAISSEDCAKFPIKTTFSFLFGSYFWDWDTERNLLRSVLASSPYSLLVAWIGRPFWHFHHFAFGYPFSLSFIKTANNKDVYNSTGKYGKKGMHLEVIGDPTLRINYPKPASNFTYNFLNDTLLILQWEPPADTSNLTGYLISKMNENGTNQIFQILPKDCSTLMMPISSKGAYQFLLRALYKKTTQFGSYFETSSALILKIVKN